jgi:hypothetical protein
MENIFYAVLALHIAGKPINKDNIRAVLEATGSPVNETALDIMAAFVEALESARLEKERAIDPRIIKFLTSELAQRNVKTKELEALLQELSRSDTSAREARQLVMRDIMTPNMGGENPVAPEKVYPQAAIKEGTRVALEMPAEESGVSVQSEGRYVYGVATVSAAKLGPIGIEGSEVYTIPYKELCAIVHNCPAEPYQSNDEEIVKSWVKAHQNVLDKAKERFGTVIPLGLDTILKPKDNVISPDQVVRDWLREDYGRLCALMGKIEGRDEYGVQVLYELAVVSRQVSEKNQEVSRIKEEMASKSPGMAYIYKQKLEKALKAEMERLADEWFKDFYSRIKRYCDDIMVEKAKKMERNKVMLLNLSCLVAREKVEKLGEELEKIHGQEGFSVRFTGPWPPYSFVAKPVAKEG